MRLSLLLLLFFFSCSIKSFAQKQGTVKGVTFDSAAKKIVANATITLLRQKDSSLVSFTMTDHAGRFELTGIMPGQYRILITHINYQNSHVNFSLTDNKKSEDLGNIIMNDKALMLGEVIVKNQAPPITLVGDTIQYNAGSFKTAPNANVESLLKKLPGVKVDKDGTIKAQGEKVQKVLVDGKEFFGNDPKIATKNLPADAVDKVQVYDKQSDQAQLTGFDDGNSEKTINLQLKKDKKKGMFGKLTAGAGTGNRYESRFNINSFKGARQLSAIGMGNNSNAEGFSFMDVLNFTGAMNQLKNGGGNININIDSNDPLAGLLGGNNTGINTIYGGGFNYNNIAGNKTELQSNYFYSRYNPVKESIVQRTYFLPANLYNEKSYSNNLNNNHRFNANIDYHIDSFNSIKISPSISYQQTKNKTLSDYSTYSDAGFFINDGNSNNSAYSEGYNFTNNILFRKKFRRKRRTFSLNFLSNMNSSTGYGTLQAITGFYDRQGTFLRRDSIDEKNNNGSSLKGYSSRAVYTEPLFKRSILEFSMGNGYSINKSSKETYDYDHTSGKVDRLNPLLTNDYTSSYGFINAGLRIRKQTKKYNYAAGLSWQQADLAGRNYKGSQDSSLEKRFNNFLPTARFQYYFSRFKNILVNYNTSTNPPSISQLQPLPDNSNPLYIKLGNPTLKQEYTHTLRVNASLVNPYRNRNLFVFLTLQMTQDKIVNYDRINSLGIDSVMPVNVSGVYNMNGTVSWGFPIRILKGSIDLSSNFSYYRGRQFANGLSNTINTIGMGPDIRLDMNPTDKLNVSLSAGIQYSNSTYSIASTRRAEYIIQNYDAGIDWQLHKGFYLGTDINYRINNQQSAGYNDKVPFWNASVSKQVLRFNRGELKLSAKDLLNQNVGISHSTNQNYIEDSRVNNLKRFFLLSFTYNLTRTGLSKAGEGGGMRVITR